WRGARIRRAGDGGDLRAQRGVAEELDFKIIGRSVEIALEAGAGDIVHRHDHIGIDQARRHGGRGGDRVEVGEVDGAVVVQSKIDLAVELEVIELEIYVQEANLHAGGRVVSAAVIDFGGGGEVGI